MNMLTTEELDKILLRWENETPYAIVLQLEKEIRSGEAMLCLQNEQFTWFLRPKGFQLTAKDNKAVSKHFAVLYDEIQEVQLLPSFSIHKKNISIWLSSLLSGLAFFVAGELILQNAGTVYWLPCGLVFGAVISLKGRITYRRNILLMLKDGKKFLFSVSRNKMEVIKAIDFFSSRLDGKFKIV